MLTDRQIELVQTTSADVEPIADQAAALFYGRLFELAPGVRSLFADDMTALSPSVRGLQKLIDACSVNCIEWDIKLNAKKSSCLVFGKGKAPQYGTKLDGNAL